MDEKELAKTAAVTGVGPGAGNRRRCHCRSLGTGCPRDRDRVLGKRGDRRGSGGRRRAGVWDLSAVQKAQGRFLTTLIFLPAGVWW